MSPHEQKSPRTAGAFFALPTQVPLRGAVAAHAGDDSLQAAFLHLGVGMSVTGDALPDGSGQTGIDESIKLDFPVPRFFLRKADGLFVDLAHFQNSSEFRLLVDRLVASGCIFRGLDYPAFASLLFEFDVGDVVEELDRCKKQGRPALIRWADALEKFDPVRAGLYRAVQSDGAEVEYLFERTVLEVEVPVDEADSDDQAADTDSGTRIVEQEARLDFDEFVVHLWVKGVRFGLDDKAIREAVDTGWLGRLVVARALPPEDGEDATVRELANGLHRDDSPRVLSNGRADLTQFSSRFPQVRNGARLMQKVPVVHGIPGRDVTGEELQPPVPQDFDLEAMAGEGTRVEREGGCEYLVAAMNGFLNIDGDTNQLSVSEKIINKQGVNIRTTGNLALMGDEYEEFGEIQERRTVEGKSITTHADVFGNLVSTGGTITIKRNISGGSATNRDGPVIVEGLAVNAVIIAPRGEIRVRRAENCVLSGQAVRVLEAAIACDIHGDEVHVAVAEGCAVAGESVSIESARARGGNECMVSMLLPDEDDFDSQVQEIRKALDSLDEADVRARESADQARQQPDVAKYLALAKGIRTGEIKLKASQKPAFESLAFKAAPMLKALGALSAEVDAREQQRAAAKNQLELLEMQQEQARQAVGCRIAQMNPGVIVRTLTRDAERKPLSQLSPSDLRTAIRATGMRTRNLTDQGSGEFEWRLIPAGEAENAAE